MYVEDNPLNMRLVRKMLSAAGYDLIEAMDGTSGIEMARREHPDLILMDINLPDIDGLEAVALLKQDPDIACVPVIAVTANSMHGDRERCLDGGCMGYIAKPITRIELLNTVTYFMQAPVANMPMASSI